MLSSESSQETFEGGWHYGKKENAKKKKNRKQESWRQMEIKCGGPQGPAFQCSALPWCSVLLTKEFWFLFFKPHPHAAVPSRLLIASIHFGDRSSFWSPLVVTRREHWGFLPRCHLQGWCALSYRAQDCCCLPSIRLAEGLWFVHVYYNTYRGLEDSFFFFYYWSGALRGEKISLAV